MELKDAFEMITEAIYGFLATSEGEKPKVRPMRPCVSDAGTLLISVLPGRRCTEHIKVNDNVEMCFMGKEYAHCRVAGKAKMTEDVAKKKELLEKAPDLYQFVKGVDDPNYGLIEVHLNYAEIVPAGAQKPVVVLSEEM